MAEGTSSLNAATRTILNHRELDYQIAQFWQDVAKLDIYFSTGHYQGLEVPGNPPPKRVPMKREEQAQLTAGLGDIEQTKWKKSSGKEDKVAWYPSAETPVCEACGTGPPTQSR